MVTVSYKLSVIGQKASLLAGGIGRAVQMVQVKPGDPEYPLAVELAKVDFQGVATLDLHASAPQIGHGWKVREYDATPAVADLLRHEVERVAWLTAEAKRTADVELAELKAGMPDSLLQKSFNYGWVVTDKAKKHKDAIGAERMAEAQEEAQRRNQAEADERAQAKAEAEAKAEAQKKAKAAQEARELTEIEAWAAVHGSPRLQRCLKEGIQCRVIYREERLVLEYPGWEIDGDAFPNWEDPRNPRAEGLELLDRARASLPASWTDEEREFVELKFWSKKDEDGDKHTGYVAIVDTADWVPGPLVYGYDGPRD